MRKRKEGRELERDRKVESERRGGRGSKGEQGHNARECENNRKSFSFDLILFSFALNSLPLIALHCSRRLRSGECWYVPHTQFSL